MKIQVERIITNSQIQFKTSMLKFGPCDYIDVYIPLKGTLNVVGQRADTAATATNRKDKELIRKNCPSFTNYTSELNNTQVDYGEDIDSVKPMYHLIEYNNTYSKTSRIVRIL